VKAALVIGYGNTVRRDDGAGVRAAELIEEQLPDVDCLYVHDLRPELSSTVAQYDTVIFLDAAAGNTVLNVREVRPALPAPGFSTHVFSPETVLGLCMELSGVTPSKSIVVEIPAYEFGFGEELSRGTALEVRKCAALVDSILKSTPCSKGWCGEA
jgi:hydrogenase maturation protease